MEFIVPQFIEKEPKIFGPFTFKQFVFVGIAIGASIMLFFILPFHLFIIVAFILIGTALALAVGQIEGIPLYAVVVNAFFFFFRPKIYLWKKKNVFPQIQVEKPKIKEESKIKEEKKESLLKVTKKGYLKDLLIYLETNTK